MSDVPQILARQQRVMSSTLLAVRTMARQALRTNRAPDFESMAAPLRYLKRFSEGIHASNEERFLFQPLETGQPAMKRILARFRRDHSAMKGYGNRLRTMVGYWRQGDANAGKQASLVADDYVRFCRVHARAEQDALLRAALQTFSLADWARLDEALEAVDDPLMRSKSRQECAAALRAFAG